MRMRILLSVLLILLTATVIIGQSTKLKGRVMDSSGLVMTGVQIKVYQGERVVKQGTTTASGDFEIPVSPGEYKLEITARDFDTHIEMVEVTPDLGPLSITMGLAQISQNVEVTETRNEISIDSDTSLNTTVLDKELLDSLPDDENELAAYLQQIAGSRGGAGGGGSFVIDGFGSGRIPPKDQIQEIRINNNPFSAEFSGIGFGRVEIITKAGTGDWRGNMNFMFRDESLNARNPFADTKPPYQQRNFNSGFSGPLIRNKLSMNLNMRNSMNENSGTIRATLLDRQLSIPYVSPNSHRSLNARTQWAISKNNTMNFNIEYGRNRNRNQGVGDFNLESRASDRTSRSAELQVRETAILTKAMIHEVRFQFSDDRSTMTPRTDAGYAINVLDSFFAGSGQNRSSNRNRDYEFGNLLMYSAAKMTLKAGFQGVYRQNHALSENNFIGTYTFSSLRCRTEGPDPCAGAFEAGRPTTFSRNQGNPRLDVNQLEYGMFLQTDWKLSKKFNLSLGTRYQGQTNISDHNNVDPRMGFGYVLSKTMSLRGGLGIFHQRFDQNNVEQLIRLDGEHQQQIVIASPLFPDPFRNANGTVAPIPPKSIRIRGTDLATPYNINSALSIEKSLPKGLGLTFSWNAIRGVHLFRSRNINAPLPGTPRDPITRRIPLLDPAKGNINQLESTGTSRSNNYTIGFNQILRNKWNLSLFGNYTLGWAYNDTDGAFSLPANNYDLASEWGRTPFDTRQRFFAGINFRAPWGVNVNSFVMANSNTPFNITTGFDDNGDTNVNDRPAGIQRNSGIGPANFNMNLNLSKTVNLKKAETPPAGRGNNGANPFMGSFAEPQEHGKGFPGGMPPLPPGALEGKHGGPGQGGRPGGEGRGPGGPGGPGGGQGRGPGGFGPPRGPTMAFVINIQNLLNNQQLGRYSGVMTSPFFGHANRARQPRQIEVGMRFSF